MKWTKTLLAAGALALMAATIMAHPHFSMKVETKLGETPVTLNYFTAPANTDHLANVKEGAFNKAFASITLGGDLTVGGNTFAAGDYHVGAIKEGDNWVMALHEGKLGFQDAPDMSKVTKLESKFQKLPITSEHIHFNILPGEGELTGRAVLTWTFANLHLAGALTDAAGGQ